MRPCFPSCSACTHPTDCSDCDMLFVCCLFVHCRMQEPSESSDAEIISKVNRAINTPMGAHTTSSSTQRAGPCSTRGSAHCTPVAPDDCRCSSCHNSTFARHGCCSKANNTATKQATSAQNAVPCLHVGHVCPMLTHHSIESSKQASPLMWLSGLCL